MWRRMRALVQRRRVEDEMALELAAHIEHYADDLGARGVPRLEAERRARVEFGSTEAAKEECREALGFRWPDELVRNVRFALRMLGRSPGFTAAVLLTLSLCIGVNTAIYSVVDAVLFRPLPYPEPVRLGGVVRWFQIGDGHEEEVSQDGRVWEALRDHARMAEYAVYTGDGSNVNLAGAGRPEAVRQHRVSAGYFRVLGVAPRMGREFTRQEDVPAGPAVVVISDALRKRRFGGNASVIGKQMMLRGEPHTIVGVMPAEFPQMVAADVWTPLRSSTDGEGSGENYMILGRLRAGATWAEADAEATVIGRSVFADRRLPPGVSLRLAITPLQKTAAEQWRKPLLVFWGAVSAVLLIGCLNVSGLLLARAAARRREMGTRMALGCGRGGIVRQLLAESLVLALGGMAGGLAAGYGATAALAGFAREHLEIWQTITIDWRVLGVTAVVAMLTSVVFGLYPAWEASRVDVSAGLASTGTRGVAGGHNRWPRRVLVGSVVALGFALLIGAALLLRSFSYLNNLSPGFDPEGLLAAKLSLRDARYETAASLNRLYRETLERLRAVPGIEAAGAGLSVPYERPLQVSFHPVGFGDERRRQMTSYTYVTPGYFEALHVPLRAGRLFTEADSASGRSLILVNDEFVRQYMGGTFPVGVQISLEGKAREIVGVVGNFQQRPGWGEHGPLAPMPATFVPVTHMSDGMIALAQTWFTPSLVVRMTRANEGTAAAVQAALGQVDPQLPAPTVTTMRDVKLRTLAMEQFEAAVLAVLAGLALLLAAVGVYGLVSTSVVERTRELGIRVALGATAFENVRTVASWGLMLAAAGVSVGWVVARAGVSLLQHFLWGIAPTDLASFLAAAGVLLAVALVASIAPALRITRLNPADTLRSE